MGLLMVLRLPLANQTEFAEESDDDDSDTDTDDSDAE